MTSVPPFKPRKAFNAPHRTGLVDFPHPALRFTSRNTGIPHGITLLYLPVPDRVEKHLFAYSDIKESLSSVVPSQCMASFAFSLCDKPSIPSSGLYCPRRALPRLLLYYEPIRLPEPHTASSPLRLPRRLHWNAPVLPSSVSNNSFTRHGLRPRHAAQPSPVTDCAILASRK